MKLEELKKMIKEEFDNFVTNEAEADDVSVDVDSDELDAEAGDAGTEDVLRQIFDLLKTHFEADGAEDEAEGEDDMGEDSMEEENLEEAPKDDDDTMEEASAMGFGDAGNKKTSGKDVGFTPAKTTRGDGKLHESVARLQKLANIK